MAALVPPLSESYHRSISGSGCGCLLDCHSWPLGLTSMTATNAGEIEVVHIGPTGDSVLTLQSQHWSDAIWNGQDPGSLTCRNHSEEFTNLEPMVDDCAVEIIKGLGLEGLLKTPGREIVHGLITVLVER
ncbi:uncharacterized protein LOC115988629 [Quercus lobata]|uniref:uncharacterized protein LOC115988629 n=1 Tax=Quercus lobata TaxID=97700 RepID=UPI0012482E85|nr:uncharacterized protein LOC115988629 [Quercus lobata]XP_030968067.1 uncharacterized protein LOC115988629 [Quercus lobata]